MPQGFLLHSRKYRETSVIASLLTESEGRLDVIIRASRGNKNRTSQPLLFCLYDLEWSGKSDLKHLQSAEPLGLPVSFSGQQLYCGFYVNELIYRLLPHYHAEPVVFALYADVIEKLQHCEDVESLLRQFEFGLLAALGYGLSLGQDMAGKAIDAGQDYVYLVDRGLVLVSDQASGSYSVSGQGHVGRGADFVAMSQNDFSSDEVKKIAKRMMRQILAHHLGGKPLRSRDFFLQSPE
ncbi:MAG TPA: DNA repair protein RecO [Pseudomonadales bacterium]|nr:DNA repair protein RecO [Pseudomonadales bacterium]